MTWPVKFNTGNLQVINERNGSSTVVSYEYCHNFQYVKQLFLSRNLKLLCLLYIYIYTHTHTQTHTHTHTHTHMHTYINIYSLVVLFFLA